MPGPSPDFSSSDPIGLPRWARAADAITLLLIGAGVIVAIGGGFRERFGGVRVAITSPWGLFIGAAVLALLRHALERREPAPARWLHAIGRRRTAAVNAALVGVLGTRPAILFVGYFAVAAFGYVHERPPVRFSENEIVNLQARWDASWYLTIATEGYRFQSNDSSAQQNIVFFPAFPMALRMVARLFGGSVVAHMFGGTGLNWVAFFFALVYLFMLARNLLESEDAARAAVLLVATYPFALFYGAIYTESLYLLGALGAFYHARRREYLPAAAWGLLVGLTRPNGCFLSIPLVLITAAPWLPAWLHAPAAARYRGGSTGAAAGGGARLPFGSFVAAVASASAPGIGVLLYCAFIWRLTGDPLAWVAGQVAWGRGYLGLGTLVSTWYSYLQESAYVVTRALPYDSLNALGALFVLALAVPVWRRLGLPYLIVILINLLPPLATGGFLSAGRMSAVMFPAFLWLGAAIPDRQRGGWFASFMAIQALNAALFYTWREMF